MCSKTNAFRPKKLVIGFITYNELTAKYLPYFLPSLKEQSFVDFDIIVADNSDHEDNKNKDYIKKHYPDIDFEWMTSNLGFAKAYNKLIEKAKNNSAKYFMLINPDTIVEKNTVSKLIDVIKKDKSLGSVCPKILSWDFVKKEKTNVVDSCGIFMSKPLRFLDLGQGEKNMTTNLDKNIIGPSGACGLFRMSALIKIKDKYGYFDSRMFMYKEDCDLDYRLFINNFKSKCVNEALVYHDRTVNRKKSFFLGRKAKSKKVKEWSLINQQLIFKKHWRKQTFLAKLSIIFYQIKIFIYILFFESYLLKYFFKTK